MRLNARVLVSIVLVVCLLSLLYSCLVPSHIRKAVRAGLGGATPSCEHLRAVNVMRLTAAQATDLTQLQDWIAWTYRLAATDIETSSYDADELRRSTAESYGRARPDPTPDRVHDDLRRQIAEDHGLIPRQAAPEPRAIGRTLSWRSDGINYRVHTETRAEHLWVIEVVVAFGDRPPSVGQIQSCLGWPNPDFYEAVWEFHASPQGRAYSFFAYFPSEGATLYSGDHYIGLFLPDEPPALSASLAVAYVKFVRPGSIGEVVAIEDIAYGSPMPPIPTPWPGSWGELRYKTEP